MQTAQGTLKALHESAVYCQVSGCGSIATFLLHVDVLDHPVHVEALCELHASRVAQTDLITAGLRKPNVSEMGRAKAFRAKA